MEKMKGEQVDLVSVPASTAAGACDLEAAVAPPLLHAGRALHGEERERTDPGAAAMNRDGELEGEIRRRAQAGTSPPSEY
ncbi:unnamed protein product [Urochloa humidicola]